jgi:hypothetical protein
MALWLIYTCMKSLKFSDYVEWADYGFDRKSVLGPQGGTQEIKGDSPLTPVKSEEIIQELVHLGKLGIYKPRSRPDIVEWGEEVGAMRVEFTPIGSSKIIGRRKIKDIKGEQTWVCKYVWPLTAENKLNDKETSVAHEIHEELEKLSMTMIDSPKIFYPEFARLVDKLTTAVRLDYPSYCMFPAGYKKINEDYYKIYFEYRGHGQNRMRNRNARSEQFDIDIFWDQKKGLVRIWGYNIDSQASQHSWQVQPSEFDEWFAPSQDVDDIIDCVKKLFLTY